ncbi:MAG TPA: hypothetical protein VL443_20555 [Cyclobacteriaceae bacterium]|jgi:hypothetical protein|nr:hypothetical protein [Cyclobacteriaceae bacterium]
MDKILNQIIGLNHKEINGTTFISTLLLEVLTDGLDLAIVRKKTINGVEFVEISSIPREICLDCGIRIHQNIKDDNRQDKIIEYENEGRAEMRLAQMDVNNSVENADAHRHEFVDHFVDPETIRIKSVTLGILLNLKGMNEDLSYFKAVHSILETENILTELRTESFKDFYQSYQWYNRTGFTSALIRTNFNPNT